MKYIILFTFVLFLLPIVSANNSTFTYNNNIIEIPISFEIKNYTIWCESKNEVEFQGGILYNINFNNDTNLCEGDFRIDKNKDFSSILAVDEIRRTDKEQYEKKCLNEKLDLANKHKIVYNMNLFLIICILSILIINLYLYIDSKYLFIVGGKE